MRIYVWTIFFFERKQNVYVVSINCTIVVCLFWFAQFLVELIFFFVYVCLFDKNKDIILIVQSKVQSHTTIQKKTKLYKMKRNPIESIQLTVEKIKAFEWKWEIIKWWALYLYFFYCTHYVILLEFLNFLFRAFACSLVHLVFVFSSLFLCFVSLPSS